MREVILNENYSAEKYAAIYARHSIDRDTNMSNQGQIRECREIAKKLNLLVYNTYEDEGSGFICSPLEREGFLKLYEDAKAGFFKNIIF